MDGSAWGKPRSSIYIALGVTGLLVAVTGFSTTYFFPIAGGSFHAPLIVHLHGLAAFCWVALFLLQPTLIRLNAFPVHQLAGMAAIPVAGMVLIGGAGTGVFAVRRDLAAGMGDFAYASIVGTVAGLVIFFCLVVAGILNRQRPETHKRLMVLATIILLWPAWFRLRHIFPGIPNPEVTLALLAADSLILIVMARDKLAEGRVHPVYLWLGPAIIAEQTLEVLLFGSAGWIDAGKAIYGALS